MYIKNLISCEEFIAGDKTVLREFLHPDKEDLKITYSLAHATVKVSEKSTPHRLRTSEVYYILEGSGIMHINDEVREVKKDDTIYIPPNSLQFIENIGNIDLKFLCIVDPAWRLEDEIIL